MAKAMDFQEMPTHPNEKRVSAHSGGTNSFVKGGGKGKKGKKKARHHKHAAK